MVLRPHAASAMVLQGAMKQMLRPFKPGEDRFAGVEVREAHPAAQSLAFRYCLLSFCFPGEPPLTVYCRSGNSTMCLNWLPCDLLCRWRSLRPLGRPSSPTPAPTSSASALFFFEMFWGAHALPLVGSPNSSLARMFKCSPGLLPPTAGLCRARWPASTG